MRFALIACIALSLAAAGGYLAGPTNRSLPPVQIKWGDESVNAQRTDGRPRLLFPAGALLDPALARTLGHPILADAANTLFVPTLTRGGKTVRFVSPDGNDLADPVRAEAGVGPMLRAMDSALRTAGRDVPEYLSLVAGEYAPADRATARFAVSCYWKGEQKLGALPGVIGTRTGSFGGEEVVEVEFDPARISSDTVARQAQSMACFRQAMPSNDLGEPLDASNQQQYHLWLHKAWHYVPLTRLQATQVNAAIVDRKSPDRFLSPTQLAVQRRLQAIYDRDYRALDTLDVLTVERGLERLAPYASQLHARLNAMR